MFKDCLNNRFSLMMTFRNVDRNIYTRYNVLGLLGFKPHLVMYISFFFFFNGIDEYIYTSNLCINSTKIYSKISINLTKLL